MLGEFLFLLISWGLFILGTERMKNYVVTAFGSLLIMVFGFYCIGNPVFGLERSMSFSLAVVHIGLGLYFIARQSEELLIKFKRRTK
jgi:hypothetical protein